jgi:hypothetical protein
MCDIKTLRKTQTKHKIYIGMYNHHMASCNNYVITYTEAHLVVTTYSHRSSTHLLLHIYIIRHAMMLPYRILHNITVQQ